MTKSGEVFLVKILQMAAQRPTKVLFFPYKQASVRNDHHEWLRKSNALYCVIYYEKFRKVIQQTEKEALTLICSCICKHLDIA